MIDPVVILADVNLQCVSAGISPAHEFLHTVGRTMCTLTASATVRIEDKAAVKRVVQSLVKKMLDDCVFKSGSGYAPYLLAGRAVDVELMTGLRLVFARQDTVTQDCEVFAEIIGIAVNAEAFVLPAAGIGISLNQRRKRNDLFKAKLEAAALRFNRRAACKVFLRRGRTSHRYAPIFSLKQNARVVQKLSRRPERRVVVVVVPIVVAVAVPGAGIGSIVVVAGNEQNA